ncbi:T9SS type A sorting domain-containing protein [Formosa sp. 3Alg 14/1]|uniref:T9SS type A sorting domain-containing protein n=1 Tax=Formosa sp. 3Alg 14/1 TaxID=3382190 RepID=UPI0039BDE342
MKQTLLSLCLVASLSVFAQNEQPTIQNGNLNQIEKSSGSDCSCSQWINKDLGDQAENSTTGLTDEEKETTKRAIKFDDFESDLMYQEVAVIPGRNYKLTYEARVNSKGDEANEPSQIEIRILKGSGYSDDYTVQYYDADVDPKAAPQSGFGYSDITVAELPANNIVTEIRSYPGDQDRHFYEIDFQSGDETSIALLFRGIGRATTPPVDDKEYTWSAGEDETFIYSVQLTNEGETLSINKNEFASNLKVFPNPASSSITISSGNGTKIDSVELYNVIGSRVLSTSNLVNSAIDVSEMASGIYILKVIGADRTSASKRVIIE